jgi:hypothetical protein
MSVLGVAGARVVHGGGVLCHHHDRHDTALGRGRASGPRTRVIVRRGRIRGRKGAVVWALESHDSVVSFAAGDAHEVTGCCIPPTKRKEPNGTRSQR